MACPIHVFSDEGELWLCDLSAAGRAMVSLPRPQAEDLAWLSDLSAEGREMVGEEAIAKGQEPQPGPVAQSAGNRRDYHHHGRMIA